MPFHSKPVLFAAALLTSTIDEYGNALYQTETG